MATADLPLVLSFLAILISILSWVRNRKIYGVLVFKVPKQQYKARIKVLNGVLKLGRFSVITVSEDPRHYIFILGNVARRRSFDKKYLERVTELID